MTAEATEPPVPASLRRERMLAEIKEREFVRVGELSSRFGVSEVTVRGDLDSLAARGKVHRVRGGAIPRLIPRQEQPFEDSISSFAAEKVAIAQAAAALLEDGETVLVDVGTTAAAAARAIAARAELSDVVVFTNGLKTALELEPATPRITVVVLGGTLVLLGFWLEEHAPAGDADFAEALARGLIRFATFLGAQQVTLDAVAPAELRERIRGAIEGASTLRVAIL